VVPHSIEGYKIKEKWAKISHLLRLLARFGTKHLASNQKYYYMQTLG